MQFQDELAAGTVLVRPALQSPDYVPNVSGWSIDIDGSAEFNSITIRGAGTTIPVVIGPAGGPQVRIGSTASAGYVDFPTNRPIENNVATILAGVLNSGAANEAATLQLLGPTVDGATDRAQIYISSQNNDGSSEANVQLRAGSGILAMDETLLHLFESRMVMTPNATASPALYVAAEAGHTGDLLNLSLNAAEQFVVNSAGTLDVYAGNAWTAFSPIMNNTGGAVFDVEEGYYVRTGKRIDVWAYLHTTGAGAGAAAVTVDMPFDVDRTIRQEMAIHCEGITAARQGPCILLALNTLSGPQFDRIRGRDNVTVTGADILAGAHITITGSFWEA